MRRIAWVTAAAAIVYGSAGCSSGESIPPAAMPTFSPAAGTYTAPQSVTLSCATPGATVHYTTDGSDPTTASGAYSSPIAIPTTTTIKAVAVATGYTASAVAIGTYTINLPTQTATPIFTPAPATYASQQSVTLSCATPGATIHYTLDGSAPTASSTAYAGPITVSATTTVKAIALATGFTESGIASGVYTITPPGQVATPSFAPVPGVYPSAQSVTLDCATTGATIHYTLDGSAPTTSSTVYASPITVSSTTTIKAVAAMTGLTTSEVASGTFTITTVTPAATPTFSPPSGSYTGMQFVTVSSTTPGARIYYTHDGSTPTTSSRLYGGPIELAYALVLKAIAVADGFGSSEVAVATYDIRRTNPTATPTFSPAPGTYTSPQHVTLSCATPDAKILYTTDGTLPDIYSQYSGPITVSSTTTIRASAWVSSGDDLSDLAVGNYTIVAGCTLNQPFPGCYVGDVCHAGHEDGYCGGFNGPCLACPAECYCLWSRCWYRDTGDPCSAPYAK
jgi:hypothetical protein